MGGEIEKKESSHQFIPVDSCVDSCVIFTTHPIPSLLHLLSPPLVSTTPLLTYSPSHLLSILSICCLSLSSCRLPHSSINIPTHLLPPTLHSLPLSPVTPSPVASSPHLLVGAPVASHLLLPSHLLAGSPFHHLLFGCMHALSVTRSFPLDVPHPFYPHFFLPLHSPSLPSSSSSSSFSSVALRV